MAETAPYGGNIIVLSVHVPTTWSRVACVTVGQRAPVVVEVELLYILYLYLWILHRS